MGALQDAFNFFKSQGWSDEQAAGIVGNLHAESGLNPQVKPGDNGLAVGIGQWHPTRQANFRSVFGKDLKTATFAEQLNFVQWELTNPNSGYMAAGNALKNAKTVKDATEIVMTKYERPKNASSFGNRLRAAISAIGGDPGSVVGNALDTAISGLDIATNPNTWFDWIKDNSIAFLVGVGGVVIISYGLYSLAKSPIDAVAGMGKNAILSKVGK